MNLREHASPDFDEREVRLWAPPFKRGGSLLSEVKDYYQPNLYENIKYYLFALCPHKVWSP